MGLDFGIHELGIVSPVEHFKEIGILADLLTEAFFFLPQSAYLVPDVDNRARVLRNVFALNVETAMNRGTIWTTPNRAAVALWLPGPIVPDDYDQDLKQATGAYYPRFVAFDQALAEAHPTTPHSWLVMMGVLPGLQRRGAGTALLHAHCARLDAAGKSAYLEAASPGLRDWYRRAGWKDHGGPITMPRECAPMFPMWREPYDA